MFSNFSLWWKKRPKGPTLYATAKAYTVSYSSATERIFIIYVINIFKDYLVRIDSLNKLKKFLNEKFVFHSRVSYYNSLHGKGSKILTQMRLGLSPLKGHLFVYNLEDNPFCQGCLSHIETTSHYLFECVKFRNEREVYLSNLAGHLHTVNLPFESWNLNEMVNLCTGGSIALDSVSNFHILNSTICFINTTRRFIY